MPEIVIAGHRIADDTPCYVVAEIGHNHGGSVKLAGDLIRSAAACGAHAVKFQKRDVDALYTQALLEAPYDTDACPGRTYGAHRRALEFDYAQYVACQAVAQGAGVELFATAFDERSADFLMTLEVPAIKIASGAATDDHLLRYVGRLGIPMIVSTGGLTWSALDYTVSLLRACGATFALFHCTAAYPVFDFTELNLRAILEMRRRYPDVVVGWSGHDSGIAMALVAYAFGARIIEKHFTLNRAMQGTDHAFSLEPVGLRKLCRDLQRAHEALGDGVKRLYESERGPLAKMRRMLRADGRLQIGP